jgi:hypothetical protein
MNRGRRKVMVYKLKRIHFPCTKCKGGNFFTLTNVREHLIHNGRELFFRVWKGPSTRDSIDEEWEEFRKPTI